ncbi:putative membrane protein [Sinorhizobium fredii]
MGSKANGYVFALLAIVIFSIQDGLSKHLGSNYPPVFVAMIRYWAFAAFAVTLAWRSPAGLRATAVTKRPLLQISRGVLLPAQIVVVITAFTVVGLAHSQAILAATPIFVALLSMPLLGERVGWRRWSAITAGLVGVLLILKPGEGTFDVDFLLPLAGALMFAVYAITTRLVSREDSAMTSFFYTGVVGAAAISLVGPFLLGDAVRSGLGVDDPPLRHRQPEPLFPHPRLRPARCGGGAAAHLSSARLRLDHGCDDLRRDPDGEHDPRIAAGSGGRHLHRLARAGGRKAQGGTAAGIGRFGRLNSKSS